MFFFFKEHKVSNIQFLKNMIREHGKTSKALKYMHDFKDFKQHFLLAQLSSFLKTKTRNEGKCLKTF